MNLRRLINKRAWAKAHINKFLRIMPEPQLEALLDKAKSGDMNYTDACGCLVAFLTAPENGHDDCPTVAGDLGMSHHWNVAVCGSREMNDLDHAYRILGIPEDFTDPGRGENAINEVCQKYRDEQLILLINAEILRRIESYAFQEKTETQVSPVSR